VFAETVLPSTPQRWDNAADVPRLAGYEILGELGRGAMGVVYKARQSGLNRIVALKMILAGSRASPEDLKRFQTEAEAVAQLRHPNIIQVYEVGSWNGRPYCVLEFVEGGTLEDKIDHTPQPPREAARVLRQLAEAMDCAHRRGIVHRDLKPANVLLGGKSEIRNSKSETNPKSEIPKTETAGALRLGVRNSDFEFVSDFEFRISDFEPKITDFGLAKRLDQNSGQTQDGTVMGTPSYMAPEQAEGKVHAVGPAADVYGLGAILYDLLTGGPPFRGHTVLDTLQQVIHLEPLPPVHLQPTIPRDLQTICLKCLEKDPRKRYPSAAALADDLQRFLDDQPIRARATPAWERLAKWTRRRPAVAALIAVSCAALVSLGAGGILYARQERHRAAEAHALSLACERQRARAEANFQHARDAVQELTLVGQQRLAHEPHMELVRRDLLEKSLRFHQCFVRINGDAPELRGETGRAHLRVGEIEEMLGRHEPAEESYRTALASFTALAKEDPGRPEYLQDLAAAWNGLALLLQATQRRPEAEDAFRQALALNERLVTEFPASAAYRRDLANGYTNRGQFRQAAGQLAGAEQDYQRALELLQRLAAEFPSVADYRQQLAQAHLGLGAVWTSRQPRQAEKAYERALELWAALTEQFPTDPRYRQQLAVTHLNRGALRHLANQPAPAEEDYERAGQLLRQLAQQFRSVPDYRQLLTNTYFNLGQLLRQASRPHDAEKVWRRAAPVLQTLVDEFPAEPGHRRKLGQTRNEWAIALASMNRHGEAEKAWREALDLQEQLLTEAPRDAAYWQDLIESRANLTSLLIALSPSAEAEKSCRLLVDAQRRRAEAFPGNPLYLDQLARAWHTLAELLRERDKGEEARLALEAEGASRNEARKAQKESR
jgi:serine/threonine protein kinase/tetratricopeptide (TPR) repeat protein